MPQLTRRRYFHRPNCWHVYYGDVHVGTIAACVGNPDVRPLWDWRCGFYPGCGPGEHRTGRAPTFEEARAAFERAWQAVLPNRNQADFASWRDERDWTTEKYRRF